MVDWQVGIDADNDCSFCSDLIHTFLLVGNIFTDNSDDVAFYEALSLDRANIVLARGGRNFDIKENTITHSESDYAEATSRGLTSYYQGLPTDFWAAIHSPFYRLDVPDAETVVFNNNTIAGMTMVQQIWEDLYYDAAILWLENTPTSCAVTITGNDISDVQAKGNIATNFFSIGAASLEMRENNFANLGHLDQTYHNFTTDYDYEHDADYYAIDMDYWASRQWTQGGSLLRMDSGTPQSDDTSLPMIHNITDNTFSHIYCERGCIIQHEMTDKTEPAYFEFNGNSYENIFG